MTSEPALARLRSRAGLATLFTLITLGGAVAKLGFVQTDPIRAPARAQDLILRHRVRGYRAGDLERSFACLGLEEDFLHAYGFATSQTAALIHPRPGPDAEAGVHVPSGLAAEMLAFVRERGPTHPTDLDGRFGRERAVNGWGGFSKAPTRALERLHRYGLLRVARRRDGIRIYKATTRPSPTAGTAERAHALVMLVVRLLAPVVAAALKTGEMEQQEVDGEVYLWPIPDGASEHRPVPRDVRLLAPFDPVVWDRRRFEHLWGWAYRFEAYTPPPKRQFGYYALPLLWGDEVIGWANVGMVGGRMEVETGYACLPPRSLAFRRALDAELARMERFLATRTLASRDRERAELTT